MTQLSPEGKRLLAYVAGKLKIADPSDPRTFPTYSDAHAALGLQQIGKDVGQSLQLQGLNNLAGFVVANGLPAITGLIVRKVERDPGKGFFVSYGKDDVEDIGWWLDEISKAARVNWSLYL